MAYKAFDFNKWLLAHMYYKVIELIHKYWTFKLNMPHHSITEIRLPYDGINSS